jgi:hypothetical protein
VGAAPLDGGFAAPWLKVTSSPSPECLHVAGGFLRIAADLRGQLSSA